MKKKSCSCNRKRKRIIPILAAIVLLAVIAAAAVLTKPDRSSQLNPGTPPVSQFPEIPTEAEPLFLDLGQHLAITAIAPYSGPYMEDGTDIPVTDVLMVILENRSEQALQYGEITMKIGDAEAKFSVTNLPARQSAVLLEKNRMAYSDDAPSSWQIQNTMFLPEFQMHPDVFEITGEAGQLTVKNISDKAVSGEVYVYYKNSGADLFYGGITYRARVEGGLEPGESKQIIAAHYAPTTSAILMVSYIP